MISKRPSSEAAIPNAKLRETAHKHPVRMEDSGLLEAVPDAMVVVSGRGAITHLNRRAENQFGYGHNELLGQNISNIIPAGFAERQIAAGLRSAMEAKAQQMGVGIELIGRRKDGSEFPIDLMLSPLSGAEQGMMAAAIRDLSERKDAQADLSQLEGKYHLLQEAERLKNEFISTVSHELRTPLTSISGSLGLIMNMSAAGTLPESVTRLVEIAHRSSQRLVRLVSDILDTQKMEYGLIVFNFKRVELRPLVELAIEANRSFADGYGVQIRLEDGGSSSDVRADSDRLIQVVTNLLSNAIKFTPRGTEVTVSIENKPDLVRLSVRDHGPGIPAGFVNRIFHKFTQVDGSNARPKDGTGLGLSIVKQIVDRLGGEVGFAGAPGGGTTFHVDLPSWEQGERIAIDPDAKSAASRILLCEDDPYTSIALRDQLQHAGFATDFAYDPAEAIKYAKALQYRAVLVDLLLPEGDGISLIQSLRELPNYSETPIVVVSCEAKRASEGAGASELNVLDWLNKPVDFDHLKRVLTKPAAPDAQQHA